MFIRTSSISIIKVVAIAALTAFALALTGCVEDDPDDNGVVSSTSHMRVVNQGGGNIGAIYIYQMDGTPTPVWQNNHNENVPSGGQRDFDGIPVGTFKVTVAGVDANNVVFAGGKLTTVTQQNTGAVIFSAPMPLP